MERVPPPTLKKPQFRPSRWARSRGVPLPDATTKEVAAPHAATDQMSPICASVPLGVRSRCHLSVQQSRRSRLSTMPSDRIGLDTHNSPSDHRRIKQTSDRCRGDRNVHHLRIPLAIALSHPNAAVVSPRFSERLSIGVAAFGERTGRNQLADCSARAVTLLPHRWRLHDPRYAPNKRVCCRFG